MVWLLQSKAGTNNEQNIWNQWHITYATRARITDKLWNRVPNLDLIKPQLIHAVKSTYSMVEKLSIIRARTSGIFFNQMMHSNVADGFELCRATKNQCRTVWCIALACENHQYVFHAKPRLEILVTTQGSCELWNLFYLSLFAIVVFRIAHGFLSNCGFCLFSDLALRRMEQPLFVYTIYIIC